MSHSEYVIVAGGGEGDSDDIEIILLNTNQPDRWTLASILLPEPMWAFYPSISDKMMYIVGYSRSSGRTNSSYRIPMDLIISSTSQQAISGHLALWTKLPSAPYYDAITIPNSHPPLIMGGKALGLPMHTSDVAMLDEAQRVWKRVSSLSCPRGCAAVVSIDSDTILILGGCIFLKPVNVSDRVHYQRANCSTTR